MPELKADKVLQERIGKHENIKVILNTQTTEISGDSSVSGLTYKNRENDEVVNLNVEGVFVQIGLVPNTEWLNDYLDKNRQGEVIVDDKGATSIPGVYGAGDCTNSPYKQIVISIGSGATAALSAADYLAKNFE